VHEVANSIGLNVIIFVEPHAEGGLRDIYNFAVSQKGIGLATWGTLLISLLGLVMQIPSKDDRMLSKLSVVKAQLEIEKLQLEIAQLKKDDQETNIIESIQNNVKIRRQKSNFYSKAIECRKIQKIEISGIEFETERVSSRDTISIDRKDFFKFVENDIIIPTETIENAIIEIIAPVLVMSKLQWKGILKGIENKKIDFKMLDNDFRNDVLRQKITFRHGSHIECALELHKKVDIDGNIIVSKYDVVAVTQFYDGTGTDIITSTRKRRKPLYQHPELFD